MSNRSVHPLHSSTRAAHVGINADPATGSLKPSIHATSTYKQDGPGQLKNGNKYGRYQNPNRSNLEDFLTDIEGGGNSLAFSSGMAAFSALLLNLPKDSHVISATDDVYHGTRKLLSLFAESTGLQVSYVLDATKESLEAVRKPNTRLIIGETITNPLLKLLDVPVVAEFARANNLLFVADNTVATSLGMQPLAHGAHIVLVSTTKEINGHHDAIGGALIFEDSLKGEMLSNDLRYIRDVTGGVSGAFDDFLIRRGAETYDLRIKHKSKTVAKAAPWLEKQDHFIDVVRFPGLPSHPQYELGQRLFSGVSFGSLITFDTIGGKEAHEDFIGKLTRDGLITLGDSLGGNQSLINLPGLTMFEGETAKQKERFGIKETTTRFAIGSEDWTDLKHILSQAIPKTPRQRRAFLHTSDVADLVFDRPCTSEGKANALQNVMTI